MELGNVSLEFLGHAGFFISSPEKFIIIDPYNISEKVPKADIILITHSHYDHCSIKDISKLTKKGTVIVTTPDAQSKITKIEDVEMQIIEVGDEIEFENLKIQAVPAYNVDKDFHPKEEGWVGYVVKLKNTVIYHAGDTDKIPEMKSLSGYGKHNNNFIVLLPVSGTYVMTAEEAAEIASLINPSLAIPMHYGAGVAGTIEDANRFVKLCTDLGINAKVLPRYNG